MAWPVLLGCVWLWAGPALAEVGTFDKCQDFFYKKTSPSGFAKADTANICQRYQNRYHFATLYNKANRIPLWSAYTLDGSRCSQQTKKRSKWFVEPQLSDQNKSPDMTTEAESTLSKDELRSSQAVNEDYEDTSYDRGHLNPNAFQCDERRTATFTLTNAAPMDPCFNRIHWYQLEKTLKAQISGSCKSGIPYLVTGTVPNVNVKIPMQSEDEEGDRSRPFNQVSVPSHIWTAVCCDDIDSRQKFSLAFLAENREESKLRIMSVKELNAELTRLYVRSVKVFADDCGSENDKVKKVVTAVRSTLYNTFQILLSDRYSQLLPGRKRNRLDAETAQMMCSQNLDQNSLQLTNVRFAVGFPDLSEWQKRFTNLYVQDNLACVLTPAAAAEVAKDSGISDRECTLQEQKHLPDSRVTAQGWSCVGAPCGYYGYAFSWCYTSHGNDWDYCCTSKCSVNPDSEQYECSKGDGSTTSCSPQYSAVTVTGKPCRADHPCGLYGKGYYWCYTDYKQTWEYCCSPQHYCGYHTYSYQWCYIKDAKGAWEYCTP
nr:uncharacterized protein LOC102459116 isoform X2 [Pelodiscus sinensis]|eukprot:XP_025035582.1 uncharacterized protein LOC102459116 isoform X2 [Pelodiscus sinensis]